MNVPQHVAIILDGNGRWAKAKGMPRNYGHAQGSKNVERICEEAWRMGIKYLTVYAFSTENWNRPDDEVNALMKLLRNYMKTCLKTAAKNDMKVRVIGDITRLDEDIQKRILELEEATKNNGGLNFQIAINYGSRDEMIRAIRKIAKDCVDGKVDPAEIKEETFDIKQAIEETVAAQVPLANNKGLQLDCSFGNNIPKLVKGDGQRIQQVLNCLLSNAIKFTSEGSVRVKIASMDMEGENKVKIRMAVADTGIGISEANMSKLFIRFSQVDSSDTRRYGGSGLGLVITKQIVELMGGNIQVQSKEDIGSTFIVEVPMKVVKASDDASVEIEQEEEPAVFSINAHSKARILVAEDEPVNQQVIGKLLGMAGFSYDIAENGQKAVELFKQKIYDAALFDVQMPVMDGIAATQEIREIEQKEKRKRLPIIAVTARAMFGDKERILENKLDDYIAKPYNLNDVVETLNKYIDD